MFGLVDWNVERSIQSHGLSTVLFQKIDVLLPFHFESIDRLKQDVIYLFMQVRLSDTRALLHPYGALATKAPVASTTENLECHRIYR
jgi:hypothetical protein